MTEWLFDRLKRDGIQVAAGVLYNEAAMEFSDRKPNPIGVRDPETGYWTKAWFLRRCADDIPSLPYPYQGWRVDRYKDPTEGNKAYWRLIKADDKQEVKREELF